MFFIGKDTHEYKITSVLKNEWTEIVYYNSDGFLVHTNHYQNVLLIEFYHHRHYMTSVRWIKAKDILNESVTH